jgi:hypothetical protein
VLLAAGAVAKAKISERRMRRLIAQAAGRLLHDRIRDADSADLRDLADAAARGDIGIAEAAQLALKIIR